jgi:hypothetical protein
MVGLILPATLLFLGLSLVGMERANPTKYLGSLGIACLVCSVLALLGMGPAFLLLVGFAVFLGFRFKRGAGGKKRK